MWVYTSDMRGAGTDSNVYLVVYGNQGKSDDIKLDNESNNFESGRIDTFKIETAEIGKPFKIRIWHDNTGAASAWHLDKVSTMIVTIQLAASYLELSSSTHCNFLIDCSAPCSTGRNGEHADKREVYLPLWQVVG